MNQLYITHTPAEGTLIEGTSKGDGSAEILKNHHARWSGKISSWYFPRTRNKTGNVQAIEKLADDLKAAGFSVEISIEEETRSMEQIEADKAENHTQYIKALEEKLEKKKQALTLQQEREALAVGSLPPMGEPIKIGHHSEGKHRRAMERAGRELEKLVQAQQEVRELEQKISTARHAQGAKYAPVTVFNRIEKLEAEYRKIERQMPRLTGECEQTMKGRLAQLQEQITYWKRIHEQQREDQPVYSKETIRPGDFVKAYNSWYVVARSNAKTVTVWFDAERTVTHSSRIPYAVMEGHKGQ